MLPLNRLLNNDEYQGRLRGPVDSGYQSDFDTLGSLSSLPPVIVPPWEDGWESDLQNGFHLGDIFSTDQGVNFQDAPEAFVAQENIDEWAANALTFAAETFDPDAGNDVQVDTDPVVSSTSDVCFGMIYRTLVKLVGDMRTLDARMQQHLSTESSRHITMNLKRGNDHDDIFYLTFPDDTHLGSLNTQASKALKAVFDTPALYFEAIVDAAIVRDVLGRASKEKDAVVRANINVYGSRSHANTIGREFAISKVWLQRPDRLRPGTNYENPHELQFPDVQIASTEPHEIIEGPTRLSKDAEQVRKVVSNVYASLQRKNRLTRVEGDSRLRNRLLRHQEEGLDFMLQRENGPIPPDFCLWKPLSGDDEGWYRHAVTQAKSRQKSPEIGGGILADEMGMGKTLLVLALVMNTSEDGDHWASEVTTDVDLDSQQKTRRCQATLVIVPSAILINNWIKEIKKHLKGLLKFEKYYGPGRTRLLPGITDADVVLTTYHTLVADGETTSPLHEIEWFRVVLDEAHIIRRQTTTFYRAVSALHANTRWCLTGTPIQNKLEDIGALFAFIRAHPFHSMATYRRFIAIPFDESEERRAVVAAQRLALLLDSICLRRTRDLLDLPARQDQLRVIEFSQAERKQYEQTMARMNRKLRVRAGDSSNLNRFSMFHIQLQLRILCNHGTFQQPFSWARRSLLDEKDDALCYIGPGSEIRCSACRQFMPIMDSSNYHNRISGICRHVLCSECREAESPGSVQGSDQTWSCPLCRDSGISPELMEKTSKANEPAVYFRETGASSKMDALVADVRKDIDSTKSIVFSCWTHTLDLISSVLKRENINFDRIDGGTPVRRRQQILDSFAKFDSLPVLIMTTGTGAFGLNLTSANRVFIVEPQWNPSVENQAIARALRFGQSHRVLVVRYMVKGTVEQDMRSQQERKLKIADMGNAISSQDTLVVQEENSRMDWVP